MKRIRTPEHNAKIGASNRGKKATPETLQRMSEARKGRYTGSENPNFRGGAWIGESRKEKARVYNAAKHARRHGRTSTLTLPEWLDVLEEYGRECAYCFGPFEQLDHIMAIAHGGDNTKENVVPACARCNKAKSSAKGKTVGWLPSLASRFWLTFLKEESDSMFDELACASLATPYFDAEGNSGTIDEVHS